MTIRPSHIVIIAIVVIGLGAGIGVYLRFQSPVQPPPLRRQEQVLLGKFTAVSPPRPAPDMAFTAADGRKEKLSAFRGHWLLVNLWATWCGPCIKEMPSLGRMHARLGNALEVIAISEDRTGSKVVKPFVAVLGIESLPLGYDPTGAMAGALKVAGLPTSFLIDPEGRIVAKLEGAAAWDDRRTVAALDHLMVGPRG
jgi:thiol-disulfide isomerase/thioredoxin